MNLKESSRCWKPTTYAIFFTMVVMIPWILSAKSVGIAGKMGYELIGIGVPKTVDNDLPVTDNCPGFGSTAKYNAISILERRH